MYNNGVYFLKGLPPHRGHLSAIIHASTQCRHLHVVVSDHKDLSSALCRDARIPYIPLGKRVQWLATEVQDMPHITVYGMDETHLKEYPHGWPEWAKLLDETVPRHIDCFFVGEREYEASLLQYFPQAKVIVFDPDRGMYPISATEIRKNPLAHWDYILGPARPYFAKKVLVAGGESTGKTTLTKMLAKLFHTSWSEEYGRYYAERFLGGDETHFTSQDFSEIALRQHIQDQDALRAANRICFFDTDALITQKFSELYLGETNPVVESFIDPDKYDLVLLLKPDVEWVDDGMRLHGKDADRWRIYESLRHEYTSRGFTVMELDGNYQDRLAKALAIIVGHTRLFPNGTVHPPID